MARKIKQGVKRAFNATKREFGPALKAIAKQALNEAKREVRARGPKLLKKGARFALQNMFGSGDYRTNNLIQGGINSSPNFGSTSTTYRRREALGQIISSSTAGDFKIQKFRINAGLASTFPWLSGFANNYESWKPNSIIFEYVPTSGMSVASSNTALGSVTMAAQYNPFAADPSNLIQIQGYPNAVTAAPYEHSLCGIECLASKRQADVLLIRNSNVSGSGGLVLDTGYDTLFDLCEFFIATEGCQEPNVKLGQLWVSYEITLSNPIVPLELSFNPSVTFGTEGLENDLLPGNLFATGDCDDMQFQFSTTPLVFQLQSGNIIELPLIPTGLYRATLGLTWGAGPVLVDSYDTSAIRFISSSPGIGLRLPLYASDNLFFPDEGSDASYLSITPFSVEKSNTSTYLQITGIPTVADHSLFQVTISIERTPIAYPDLFYTR